MSYTRIRVLAPAADSPSSRVINLTKREIARAIHEADPSLSVADAIRLVDHVLAMIKRELELGGKVMITNFGSFAAADRAPRRGVNPATGKPMRIARRRVVTFQPAPALAEAVDA